MDGRFTVHMMSMHGVTIHTYHLVSHKEHVFIKHESISPPLFFLLIFFSSLSFSLASLPTEISPLFVHKLKAREVIHHLICRRRKEQTGEGKNVREKEKDPIEEFPHLGEC